MGVNESWLPTEGNYEVSDRGLVRHARTGRVRTQKFDRDGYSVLNLWSGGRLVTRKVHVLVLEAFVGPRPSGLVVRHLNGNPADNHVGNLAWGTLAENAADAWRHGRIDRRGDRNPNARARRCQSWA